MTKPYLYVGYEPDASDKLNSKAILQAAQATAKAARLPFSPIYRDAVSKDREHMLDVLRNHFDAYIGYDKKNGDFALRPL